MEISSWLLYNWFQLYNWMSSHLIASTVGNYKKEVLVTCAFNIMLGSMRKEENISSVDVKVSHYFRLAYHANLHVKKIKTNNWLKLKKKKYLFYIEPYSQSFNSCFISIVLFIIHIKLWYSWNCSWLLSSLAIQESLNEMLYQWAVTPLPRTSLKCFGRPKCITTKHTLGIASLPFHIRELHIPFHWHWNDSVAGASRCWLSAL